MKNRYAMYFIYNDYSATYSRKQISPRVRMIDGSIPSRVSSGQRLKK